MEARGTKGTKGTKEARYKSRVHCIFPSGRGVEQGTDLEPEELARVIHNILEEGRSFFRVSVEGENVFVNVGEALIIEILPEGELTTKGGIVIPQPDVNAKLRRIPNMP